MEALENALEWVSAQPPSINRAAISRSTGKVFFMSEEDMGVDVELPAAENDLQIVESKDPAFVPTGAWKGAEAQFGDDVLRLRGR